MPTFPRAVVPVDDAAVTPIDTPASPRPILPLLGVGIPVVILLLLAVRFFKRIIQVPNLDWLRGKGQGIRNRAGFDLLPTSHRGIPAPTPSPFGVPFDLSTTQSATSLATVTKPLLRRSPSIDGIHDQLRHPEVGRLSPVRPSSASPTRPTRSPFKLPALFNLSSLRRSKSLGGGPVRHLAPPSSTASATSAPATPYPSPPLIDLSASSSSQDTSVSDIGAHPIPSRTHGTGPLIPDILIHQDVDADEFLNPVPPRTPEHRANNNTWAFDLVDISPPPSYSRTPPPASFLARATSPSPAPTKRTFVHLRPLIDFANIADQGSELVELVPLSAPRYEQKLGATPQPNHQPEIDVGASANVLVQLEASQPKTDQVLVSLDLGEISPVVSIDSPLEALTPTSRTHPWSNWDNTFSLTSSPLSSSVSASPRAAPSLPLDAKCQAEEDAENDRAHLDTVVAQASLELAQQQEREMSLVDNPDLDIYANPFADPVDVSEVVVDAEDMVANGKDCVEEANPDNAWFNGEDEADIDVDLDRLGDFDVQVEEIVIATDSEVVLETSGIVGEVEVEGTDRELAEEGADETLMSVDDEGSYKEDEAQDQAVADDEDTADPDLLPLPSIPEPVTLELIMEAPAPRLAPTQTLLPALSVSVPHEGRCESPDTIPLQTPTPPASPPLGPLYGHKLRPRSPVLTVVTTTEEEDLEEENTFNVGEALSPCDTVLMGGSSGGGTPVERLLQAEGLGARSRPQSRCASPMLAVRPLPAWSVRAAGAPVLGLSAEKEVQVEKEKRKAREGSVMVPVPVVMVDKEEVKRESKEMEAKEQVEGDEGDSTDDEEGEDEKSKNEDHDEIPPAPIPGSFPLSVQVSEPPKNVMLSARSINNLRLRPQQSALDIALAMQLRPGFGPGADPAWMVRFLMSMFGWFALLVSGRLEG